MGNGSVGFVFAVGLGLLLRLLMLPFGLVGETGLTGERFAGERLEGERFGLAFTVVAPFSFVRVGDGTSTTNGSGNCDAGCDFPRATSGSEGLICSRG